MGAAASAHQGAAAPAPAPFVDEAPAPLSEDDDWSWRRLELGRFTVNGVDVVGCGAHCVVRKDVNSTVAVKYYGGEDAAERLQREVRRLRQLGGSRIIACSMHNNEPGVEDGRCLLASPLYEDSLADHACGLCSRAMLPFDVTRILIDVAHALAHAHALDVVHGDVKPANIARKGRTEPWVLLDWDDAMDANSVSSECFFTALYAAPECFDGPLSVTPALDVWGLGATALEALTAGAHPLSHELDARGSDAFAAWLGNAESRAVDAFWAAFEAGPVVGLLRTLCAVAAADRPAASAVAATARELAASLPEGEAPAEVVAPRRRRAFSFFRDEFLEERLAAGVERKLAVRELTKDFAALRRSDADSVAVYAARASAANGDLGVVGALQPVGAVR